MSNTADAHPRYDVVGCPECGVDCESMDHLVDHITDEHDLFTWVTDGRPLDSGGDGR